MIVVLSGADEPTAARVESVRSLNLTPHLIAGDGAAGVPDRAPFDQIIATCAVPDIPLPWITQLAPGGTMLVNVRGEIGGGTLCLLTKDTTGTTK